MQPHSPAARALAASLVLAGGCVWQRESPDLKDKDVRLTILHTSDMHSRLLPYDLAPLKTDTDLGLIAKAAPFGGAARMASLVARERARAERSIMLDSGDCFQGAPIFNMNNGEAELRFMSLLRPDAVVIGNHEFDAGARNFAEKALQFASYPLLAANYEYPRPDQDDPTGGLLGKVSQPIAIINADGLRVGVIGMANLASLNSIVEGGKSLGVTPLEQNEVVRQWIEVLAPQVDLIGITSHLGLTEDQDLVLGYEAVYEKEKIERFLTRGRDPWTITKDFGDGRVEVHIPGVRGLDFIMGGHLHVVLNPPQVLQDLDGRNVVLSHSGAFAKYLGRLDLVVRNGEIQSHTYQAFPIDSLWCLEIDERTNVPPLDRRAYIDHLLSRHKRRCAELEDPATHRLLDFYTIDMGQNLDLPMIFAYAPRNVERRNSSGGGDSPLGNITAASMRKRRGVEAEFAVTNTLGIRDNMYAGPVTLEGMFNVFPFENTITTMYLSGGEVQELFDFMTERSSGRGCQSQGQVDGASFVMDCGRAIENARLVDDPNPETRCTTAQQCVDRALSRGASEAEAKAWSCHQSSCYRHPAHTIVINGEPLNQTAQYKVAVNDYIAKGGSGFEVLKRNTTRFDTGISLRDALIESLRQNCNCEDLAKTDPDTVARCAQLFGGLRRQGENPGAIEQCRRVELPASCQTAHDYCTVARKYEEKLTEIESAGPLTFESAQTLGAAADIYAGKCSCHEVLVSAHLPTGTPSAEELAVRTRCGHVTDALEAFCHSPSAFPVIATEEDGRIVRRVK